MREIFGLGAVFGGYWGVESSHFLLLSRFKTHFAPGSQKLGQANEVVGGDGEDEDGAHLCQPAHFHLGEPAHRLRPAEAFLDALA